MNYALRDASGQKYPVGVKLQIGRDPANQIVVQDQRASRFHCTLTENQGGLMLSDENSRNGTFVNQTQIQGSVQLHPGDTIVIGDTSFIVEMVPEQVPASQPPNVPPQTVLPPSFTQPPVSMPSPVVNMPQPPMANAPLTNQVPQKKGGINPVFPLIFIILMSLVCLAPAIVGYNYYKAPQTEKNKVLNYFGKGPANVELENFSDNTVYVFATTALETSAADENAMGSKWEITSFGYMDKTDLDSGAYRLDFGSQPGQIDLGTCIFFIKGGEVYDFMFLPDDILINRTEYPPSKDRDPASADELDVATSSLCKYSPD